MVKSWRGLMLVVSVCVVLADPISSLTVIYDEKPSTVRETLPGEKDLWLTLPALTQVSGFVLKPQGACLDELCVPIPKAREKAFLRKDKGKKWFNLSELARVLHQPSVYDSADAIWLFGRRPDVQMKYLQTLEAPQFRLRDWKQRPRSLTDFRGKKVLLITWASW